MTTTILDVSAAQGTIDWSALATAAIDGVIVKATEGAGPYVDPSFARNFAGAADHSLLVGTYHYAHPDETADDAQIEARHYVSTVMRRAQESLVTAPLLYALDIENARRIRSGAPFVAWCRQFIETVEAMTSLQCWVYTGGPFFDEHDGNMSTADAAFFAMRPLWIAAYVNDPTKYVQLTPWRSVGHTMHQYTGDVAPGGKPGIRYPGVPANVVDTNRFDGSLAELRALIGGEPVPDTQPQTPTSKSSQRLQAVNAPIVDWAPVTPEASPEFLPDFLKTLADSEEKA